MALKQSLLTVGSHAPSGWGICIYYSLHWRAKFGSLPVKSHLTLNYALRVEKGRNSTKGLRLRGRDVKTVSGGLGTLTCRETRFLLDLSLAPNSFS